MQLRVLYTLRQLQNVLAYLNNTCYRFHHHSLCHHNIEHLRKRRFVRLYQPHGCRKFSYTSAHNLGWEAGTCKKIFDHHAVIYEHANGMKHFHHCRQQSGCANDVSTQIIGSEGVCEVEKGIIREPDGTVRWKYSGPKGQQMHQAEHDEMFAGIRAGKPINNGDYMSTSTMLAVDM